MKKVFHVISVLIYLFLFSVCITVLGRPRNFGVIWVVPYAIMLISYIILLFKKSPCVKLQMFCCVFGFVISLSPIFIFGPDLLLSMGLGALILLLPVIPTLFSFIIFKTYK